MSKYFPPSFRLLLAALCLALLTSGVFASSSRLAGALLKIDLDGVVSRGDKSVPLAEAGRVSPGEVITWSMAVSNRGDEPTASAPSVDGEIHPATVYVAGSAGGDGSPLVTFSIDGGRTFSERPMESYTEGGVEKRRPAPVAAYRHVRFTFRSQIGAGEVKSVRYQARVR